MQFNAFRALVGLAAVVVVCTLCGCGGGGGGGSSVAPLPVNRAPSITISEPSTDVMDMDASQTPTCAIRFKADDPDGQKLSCVWSWTGGSVKPSETTVNPGAEITATFTPPAYNGQCKLKLSVSDGEATVTRNLTFNVTGRTAPTNQLRINTLAMSPDPVAPKGAATLTATVSNPSSKPLTYTWNANSGKIVGNGATATWQAPDIAGVYGVYLTVSDGTSEVTGGIACTVAGPNGSLRGEYFKTLREKNVVYLQTLAVTRSDPDINFRWYQLSPDPRLPGDGFGARWTGFIKCQDPGTYVFRAHADDGIRMKLMDDSGRWVEPIPNDTSDWIDHVEGAWLPTTPVPVQLQGDKWYPIQVDYFEGSGNAFVTLYWSVNGGPETIVPQEAFKLP